MKSALKNGEANPIDLGPSDPAEKDSPDLSIVIPFLDEAGTLEDLHRELVDALMAERRPYEVILVNDGSSDGSADIADAIAERDPHVQVIHFKRNFGKAAALSAGFQVARGDIVITMDADLQDDPKEIPRFVATLESGYDLVSGWKQVRNDPVDKTLPSKVFNAITARVFQIPLHDINCGFKAYRRETLQHLKLYGELHRFTPALLGGVGFDVTEIEVEHRARTSGQSKYGWNRFIKGLLDLMTVLLLTRYSARPLHFFALLGVPLLVLGSAFLTYLVVYWFLGLGPIGTRPLLQISIFLILTGIQFLGFGLVAELLRAARIVEGEKYVVDTNRLQKGAGS